MRDYPDFIIANAYVKLAAAQTNHSLGVINDERASAMGQAAATSYAVSTSTRWR